MSPIICQFYENIENTYLFVIPIKKYEGKLNVYH